MFFSPLFLFENLKRSKYKKKTYKSYYNINYLNYLALKSLKIHEHFMQDLVYVIIFYIKVLKQCLSISVVEQIRF